MGKIFDALEKSQKTSLQSKTTEATVKQEPDSKTFDPTDASTFETSASFDHNGNLEEQLYNIEALDRSLVTYFDPRSIVAEQFRILKTRLFFPESGRAPKSIMVTSAVPNEGKSFVASNLAISIAKSVDEHVLLMDCDIRLPKLHKMFGFENVSGLSEYLSSKVLIENLLRKTAITKMTLLPAGTPPENPAELLASQQMANLFKEVTSRYRDRYIIVDAPPPQITAEADALARRVDAILLVIKCGNVSKEVIKERIEKLDKEKIIGVFFNQFDIRFSNSYGHGKYGQYYGVK